MTMGPYTRAEILTRALPIALPTLGGAAFGTWAGLLRLRHEERDLWAGVACAACALLASVAAVGAVRLARLRKASWLGHVGFALLAIVGGTLLAGLTTNLWVPHAIMRGTEDWPPGTIPLFLSILALFIGFASALLAIALAYAVGVGKEWRPASRPIEHE